MKTNTLRLLFVSALALVAIAPSAFAQRQLGKKKGPTSKLYMAETKGDSQIQNGDKIYTARQSTAFDAPGTVIETKADSHNALVYSNGTGLFVDQNTRVEIDRFTQEPFRPNRNQTVEASLYEPSVSQSNVFVSHGAVGVCTSQLISGSSMQYGTPHGAVNIRGGKVSIETSPTQTVIDLLDGDVTVRGSERDIGGQILRPGERATIVPPPSGIGDPTITISPIPQAAMQAADERTEMACNAKKSVTFEVIEKKAEEGLDAPADETPAVASNQPTTENAPAENSAGSENEAAGADDPTQEIVAKPTVPENPPTNIVVSPDRLPGTGT